MLLGRFRHISIWVKLQNKNYLVSQLTELQNLICISFVCVKKVKNVFSFLSRMSNFMNLKERRLLNNDARKTMFSFSKCFENMVFPKKSHWNMIFLVLSGKMIFLFPENMILFFRHKMKDDLSQKNIWKYDIFYRYFRKMVFPGNSRLNTIFFVISGKIVFIFSRKYNIFFLGGK